MPPPAKPPEFLTYPLHRTASSNVTVRPFESRMHGVGNAGLARGVGGFEKDVVEPEMNREGT